MNQQIILLLDGAILSLKILAVYCIFQQGNILGWMRIFIANRLDKWFGYSLSAYIQKPLFDCLACMASFWGIIFTGLFSSRILHWEVILISCGINFLIQSLIPFIDGAKPNEE